MFPETSETRTGSKKGTNIERSSEIQVFHRVATRSFLCLQAQTVQKYSAQEEQKPIHSEAALKSITSQVGCQDHSKEKQNKPSLAEFREVRLSLTLDGEENTFNAGTTMTSGRTCEVGRLQLWVWRCPLKCWKSTGKWSESKRGRNTSDSKWINWRGLFWDGGKLRYSRQSKKVQSPCALCSLTRRS